MGLCPNHVYQHFQNRNCKFYDEHYDQNKLGRYDKAGFLFQVDRPINPDTEEVTEFGPGILVQGEPVPWITK